MVIHEDMPVSGVVEVWREASTVFQKYNVKIDSDLQIKALVPADILPSIMKKLNERVGSSERTCVSGG